MSFRSHWSPAPFLLGLMILAIVMGWYPIFREVLEYRGTFFELIGDSMVRDSFWLSLRTAFLGAIIAGALGTLLACCLALWVHPSRLLSFLVAAPLFIPHVVAAQMMVLTFGQSGFLNRILFALDILPDLATAPLYLYDEFGWSIIGGFVFKELPFVTLTVMPVASATLLTFGPAAQCLGASVYTLVSRVLLPNLWPAAAMATLMGFAYGMVSYEIPLLLGKTHPKALAALSLESSMDPVPSGRPQAFTIGLIIFGVTAVIGIGFFWVQNRSRQVLLAIRQALQESPSTAEGKPYPWRAGVLWSTLLLLLFPLVPLGLWSLTQSWPWPALIPPELSWTPWIQALGVAGDSTADFLRPLGNSLWLATQVTVLSTALSLPLATWLGQSSFKGQPILAALALSPLFMPTFMLATGLGTLVMGLDADLGSLPLIITHGLAFSPYLIFTLSAFFVTRPRHLEEAAATLGAPPLQVFLRVTLPGVLPTLCRGALFVFLASLGDVVLTLMVQGHETPTLTLVLMPLISGGERNLGAIGCCLLILVPLGIVGVGTAINYIKFIFKTYANNPNC